MFPLTESAGVRCLPTTLLLSALVQPLVSALIGPPLLSLPPLLLCTVPLQVAAPR